MPNPNISDYAFKKGNQIGKLSKGVTKFRIDQDTTHQRISSLLEKITEADILKRLEKIDDLNYLFFVTKILEMKSNIETKLADIEAKRELNKSNDDTQDADIVSIKLIRKSDQDNTNNTIE